MTTTLSSVKEIGDNIIKLEGYGVYVTMLDYTLYISKIDPRTGGPTLDPDKCILWDVLADPPNQDFLNITNAKFDLDQTLMDYGKSMHLREILKYRRLQEEKDAGRTVHSAKA